MISVNKKPGSNLHPDYKTPGPKIRQNLRSQNKPGSSSIIGKESASDKQPSQHINPTYIQTSAKEKIINYVGKFIRRKLEK